MDSTALPETQRPMAEAGPAPGFFPRLGLSRDRIGRWTKILSAFFTAHTLTRLLGLGAGLLLINFMPVSEFALYTLALSVVAFFGFVTDLGATGSLLYFSREARRQGEDFGHYVAAVVSLRRWVFLVGAPLVLVGFPLVAAGKGFDAAAALLAAGALLLAVAFQIAQQVRVLVLRLDDRYGQSYRAEVAGGAVRLAGVGVLIVTSLLFAWLGVLSAALASAVVAWLAARPAKPTSPAHVSLAPYRRRIVRYLLPTLPSALYYSIQGPLIVWLAAAFGGTRNIAEVGALGRLGMIVGVFSGLSGVVFLPKLAGVQDDRLYRRRFFQYGGFLLMIAVSLLAAAALAPRYLLKLLGESYSGLHEELLLVVATAGLTLLSGFAVGVNHARSWNRWQGAAAFMMFLVQVVLVATVPMGTTKGVLLFGALSATTGLLLQLSMTFGGFVRPRLVHWS